MSICPEKDLFSVHIDGELPSPHKENFLSHLNSCETCRAQYNAYENVHNMLTQDSKALDMSSTQLEQGYDRLLVKMKYHTVTKQRTVSPFPILKYAAAAAAAVFIFAVAVPLRTNQTEYTGIISRAQTAAPLMKNAGVIAEASIPRNVLSNALGSNVSYQKKTVPVNFSNESITSMDIFRPEFSDDMQTITITLDIPLPPGITIRSANAENQIHTVQYTGNNP